jgi:hypothetical protein
MPEFSAGVHAFNPPRHLHHLGERINVTEIDSEARMSALPKRRAIAEKRSCDARDDRRQP